MTGNLGVASEVGDLTWDVVAERIALGAFAILPIGAGAKQHGFHLPMRTDELQAAWLAARLAERFDALIWPVVTYGHYPAFTAYAGSVSLSEGVFEGLVQEIAGGIIGYGADVAVLDTGISTLASVERAIADFGSSALHLRVHHGPHYGAETQKRARQAFGTHADELETARILVLAPERVELARAEASPAAPPGPGPMQPNEPYGANYSRSGSIGDPSLATRETGEALLRAMLDDTTADIASWRAKRS